MITQLTEVAGPHIRSYKLKRRKRRWQRCGRHSRVHNLLELCTHQADCPLRSGHELYPELTGCGQTGNHKQQNRGHTSCSLWSQHGETTPALLLPHLQEEGTGVGSQLPKGTELADSWPVSGTQASGSGAAAITTVLCSFPGGRGCFPQVSKDPPRQQQLNIYWATTRPAETRTEFTCNPTDTEQFLSDEGIAEQTMSLSVIDKPYARKK